MKKEDAKFLAPLAACMEVLTEFTCDLLGTVFYKNEPPMSEEKLKEYKDSCYQRLSMVYKNDSEETDKLSEALADFIDELFNKESLEDNKEKYFESGKDYKLKNNSFLKREELTKVVYSLSDELDKYVKDKHLDYAKDYTSFIYNYEMEAALLFQQFQFYLFNLNNANALDMEDFEKYKKIVSYSHFQLYSFSEFNSFKYLAKNKKGEILTLEEDGKLELLLVEEEKDLNMYKKLVSKRYDGIRAIVDKDDWYRLEDEIENLKNQDSTKKEEVKDVKKKELLKQEEKKQSIEKVIPVKNQRKKFNFNFNFDAISLSSFLLSILPTLVMIAYVILLVTGVMDKITFSSSSFSGTLFGYEFELSGAMANWLEDTNHGFFSAITLGLIQVILILIGFVLDLLIHLAFLILAILWFILVLIFAMCLYYVFPVAIAIWLIINFFKSDKDDRLVNGICMGISIVCCVSYFLIGMNII